MSKKILRILFIVLLAVILIGAVRFFFFKPRASLQSIYLIPETALFIIETEQPLQNWFDIVDFPAWKRLQQVEYFASVNQNVASLDSVISENNFLLKLLGDRAFTISGHQIRKGSLDYLYTVDLKSLSILKGLRSRILGLSADELKISYRDYKGREIIELFDPEAREFLYLSLAENHLLASYNHKLIEASLDEITDPQIGRNLYFIDVASQVKGRRMFRAYLNHRLLKEFFLENRKDNKLAEMFFTDLLFSGFSFDLSEGKKDMYGQELEKGLVSMHGFSSLSQDKRSYFSAFARSGDQKLDLPRLISSRTAVYAGLGFKDFQAFYANLEQSFSQDSSAYAYYREQVDKMENWLDIDFDDDFLSWVGDEMAMIQLKPAYKSLAYETAVIFKARDIEAARDDLDFIADQIRKNTPVKFKTIDYRGHEIRYLSVSGILKLLFGKLINNMEKPYFTLIDNAVVFSAHPQTLKSMVDDYLDKRTLTEEESFVDFYDKFEKSSSLFFYINVNNAAGHLKQSLPEATAHALAAHSRQIERFPQIGIQLIARGALFETVANIEYTDAETEFNMLEMSGPYPTLEAVLKAENEAAAAPAKDKEKPVRLIIDDLDSREQTMHYDNGQVMAQAKLKNGVKHGSYKEYYENGQLKIKGRYKNDKKTGVWRYYSEEGDLMKKEKF